MAQSVLGYFPHQVGGDFSIFSKCSAVLVKSTVGEAGNMVTNSEVRDVITDSGNITREVASTYGASIAD